MGIPRLEKFSWQIYSPKIIRDPGRETLVHTTVFTGYCGKVMGSNTAVYEVILLFYYLYCLILDI